MTQDEIDRTCRTFDGRIDSEKLRARIREEIAAGADWKDVWVSYFQLVYKPEFDHTLQLQREQARIRFMTGLL